MNENSKRTSLVNFLLILLVVGAVIKLGWSIIEAFFLPVSGVETGIRKRIGPLPRHLRLASDEALPKPVRPRPAAARGSIRDLKLQAVYQGPEHRLAVIKKGSRSFVIGRGESVLGYRLKEVGDRSIVLTRNGKKYRLEIRKPSTKNAVTVVGTPPTTTASVPSTIRKEGDTTLVPRKLIGKYTKNIDKIWKDIGIVPYKSSGKLRGFKVRYIRRGSLFQKLGLKRGDIITAINGEPIEDYNTAMELYQSADTLDELTLQIKRGKQEVELNYEIQ